ncbi:MAG: phytanoyl-CoA dioxygenase [Rhodospirillaceae bacterium]|nr:phytanoyl-CoA dioxygenase [Rhodospirillaceae bacterium]|tara:strand:- start:4795 stop:5718 length:924 start_codon:yes stop_codon:yes gene_type:complete
MSINSIRVDHFYFLLETIYVFFKVYMMPKFLSDLQVKQYKEDGFISPVRVMSEAEALDLRNKIEKFEAEQGSKMHGLQRTKCSLRFPFLYELVMNNNILDAVEDLIGSNILLYQTAMWFKEPETGSYVSWHQDSSYYGMDPLDLVSAWVALSPATSESGCMQVIPGSHTNGQFPVQYTEVSEQNLLASGQNTLFEFNKDDAVLMPLAPGEISLHHVALVHSSRPNHSSDRRMGISIGYFPTNVRQTTKLKASAMLMRGEDLYGNFLLDEVPPIGADDPETIKRHETAVSLYREKAKECGNDTVWRLG